MNQKAESILASLLLSIVSSSAIYDKEKADMFADFIDELKPKAIKTKGEKDNG